MLTEMVQSGRLPPLTERLPKAPMVVKPVDQAGTYGGTWHTAMLGPSDTSWLTRTVQYEPLMRWNPDFTEAIPNVAESVDVAGEGREYTFHLRQGMRWSDGKPFTASDVVFVVNDVLLNRDLYPVPPDWLAPGGAAPPSAQAVDKHTVRLLYDQPYGLLLGYLASPLPAQVPLLGPRHYLEQFHQEYNKDVSTQAKDAGFSDWTKFYQSKVQQYENPDVPTLHAWIYTSALGSSNRLVAERNPYYWKVDPDGRQLPFIDEVSFAVVDNTEVILLRASHGELDMHDRHITTLKNKPVLARGRKSGKYHFFEASPALMNTMTISLNLAHQDDVLREVFQSKDFRIGLSHAINRPELIKAVAQGQGTPWQAAPRKESKFYDKELATQYTAYDTAKANEHLDRAGYARRDSEGFRLGSDGNRIRFAVEVSTPSLKDFWVDGMNMVKGYWADVGVDIRVKSEGDSLFYARKAANKHDACAWQGDNGLTKDAILRPIWYFPFNFESIFATAWAAWFTSGGADGQEPPEPAKRQMELYRQVTQTSDQGKQAQLFGEILQIAKEEFWVIGTMLPPEGYGIVGDNFHNVPQSMPQSYIYPTPAPTNPEQYFMT